MQRFIKAKKIGDGTYGEVYLAQIAETKETVAIKKMKKKYYSWEECLKLREIESLRKLNHPNIIRLKEVIRERDELYMIFEYMKENLYDYLKRKRCLSSAVVKHVGYQMIQGLKHLHTKGFFHRDMKPENMLLNDNGSEPPTVKIADFGLARQIRSKPPYTDYVSTRWYRAPEVLLQSRVYSAPVDIWAVGCILSELFTGRPLFPGSSEVDQLYKICAVIGTFTAKDWPDGMKLAKIKLPQYPAVDLGSFIPGADNDAIHLINSVLSWDPAKRPSAAQLLNFQWFKSMAAAAPILSAQQKHPAHLVEKENQVPALEQRKQWQPAPQPMSKTSKVSDFDDDFDDDALASILNPAADTKTSNKRPKIEPIQAPSMLPPIQTNISMSNRRDSASNFYDKSSRYKPGFSTLNNSGSAKQGLDFDLTFLGRKQIGVGQKNSSKDNTFMSNVASGKREKQSNLGYIPSGARKDSGGVSHNPTYPSRNAVITGGDISRTLKFKSSSHQPLLTGPGLGGTNFTEKYGAYKFR